MKRAYPADADDAPLDELTAIEFETVNDAAHSASNTTPVCQPVRQQSPRIDGGGQELGDAPKGMLTRVTRRGL